MSGNDLTSAPATEIARLVRERRVSPPEVVRAHLARTRALEPTLGAFVAVREREAAAEAEALAQRPEFEALPLAGVPVAVKDNVDVAGLPTRHGSAATSDVPVDGDDELVRRLRAAGCVVVGKTKMSELAIWPFTETAAFGSTHNPWEVSRTPGGSTGGGGAAVAVGMASLALGSDGGGSIRIPASCCGVFGLKPTPGLVPVAGGAKTHWYGMTAFGPLARTVADAALVLDVLAGRGDFSDPQAPDRPLTIAFSARHPAVGARAAGAVTDALGRAVSTLREAGHTLVEARPPYPTDLGLRFGSRWLAGIAEDAEGLEPESLEPRTRKMARIGRRAARRVKPAAADRFADRAGDWLSSYDAFLTPTLARAAVPIGTWENAGWVRTTLGVGNWLYTTPWNLAGLPAASIPSGSDDGLPIGVQIVAPGGGEKTILAIAAELERRRPWPRIAPMSEPSA
jgi:amidase